MGGSTELVARSANKLYRRVEGSWQVDVSEVPTGEILYLASNDIWVFENDALSNFVSHFDGSTWTRDEFPSAIVATHTSPGGSIAVGQLGARFWLRDSAWVGVGTLNVERGPGGLWAGPSGELARAMGHDTFMMRDSAGVWSRVLCDPSVYLFSVGGLAANDLFIGGDRAAFHWDGRTCQKIEGLASISNVTGARKDSLWGTVGGQLFHFDGASWTHVAEAEPIERFVRLTGVAEDDIWATTEKGLVHFDGGTWQIVDPEVTRGDIQADTNFVWILTGSKLTRRSRDGRATDVIDLEREFDAIHLARGVIYVVGETTGCVNGRSALLRVVGTTVESIPIPADDGVEFGEVTSSPDGFVYVLGSRGEILKMGANPDPTLVAQACEVNTYREVCEPRRQSLCARACECGIDSICRIVFDYGEGMSGYNEYQNIEECLDLSSRYSLCDFFGQDPQSDCGQTLACADDSLGPGVRADPACSI